MTLVYRPVVQPGGSPPSTSAALVELLSIAAPKSFRASIAYVTNTGVSDLLNAIAVAGLETEWDQLDKRFLAGVDWFRSEPTALARLAALANSQVRVHDGRAIVARAGCKPTVPWHPKSYVLDSEHGIGSLVGSGNLSRNGLGRGHENGLLTIVEHVSGSAETLVQTALRALQPRFEILWGLATPVGQIDSAYEAAYRSAPKSRGMHTDDETTVDGLTANVRSRLPALASSSQMWIETGNIRANLGAGRPGSQLEASGQTRIFFGGSAGVVAKGTLVASPKMGLRGALDLYPTTVRFNGNGMDVVNLPIPGGVWPSSYDRMVLLFTKVARGSELVFEISRPSAAQERDLRRMSADHGSSYTMTRGRQWGLVG
jgi:HKD family nuclease